MSYPANILISYSCPTEEVVISGTIPVSTIILVIGAAISILKTGENIISTMLTLLLILSSF